MYQSLYRKYRPKRFADVVGQDHIVKTLKNQIKAGKIGHAYLFCGTRGTGKTSVAKIFSKAVNCKNNINGEPCNTCEICELINSNSTMDILEIDAASNNSVNDIRELRDTIIYAPSLTKYKVYIIDEVHMLSSGAFNALLKTLEEPPAHAIFVLATTEPDKLPDTILSRCQRFDFKRIPTKTIAQNLNKICADSGIKIEDRGLKAIALYGNGSMRDAISILEQCASYNDGMIGYEDVCEMLGTANDDILYSLLDSVNSGDAASTIKQLDKILSYGIDISNLLKSLISLLRDMLMYKSGGDAMEEILDNDFDTVKEKSQNFGMAFLSSALEKFIALQRDIKYSPSPVTLLEVTLLRLIKPEISYDVLSIVSRLEKIERQIESINSLSGGVTFIKDSIDKKTGEETHQIKKDDTVKHDAKKEIKKETKEMDIDIGKIWNEAKELIKKDRITLFALMDMGMPYLKDDEIVIEYPEEYLFCKDELSKAENKEYVENVLCKILGKAMRLKFSIKKSEEEMLVEQVKALFGDDVEIVDE